MNDTRTTEPEWAAFAAIDWADQKHFWRLVPSDSQQAQSGELENTPEAVDAWAAELAVRFGGRPVAVSLEQSRGSLVYMLLRHAHLVLYPVHPATSARYRETFYPSGAKSDPSDTALLLELVMQHRDRLRRLQPDTVETRLLQLLVEQRRRMVNEKTRQSQRLRACLKLYFPQILQWFKDVDAPFVCALLKRWPSLEELRRCHPGTLRNFFHEHNCRSEDLIDERIQAVYAAIAATKDRAVLEAEALTARQLVALLEVLRANIAELDGKIADQYSRHAENFLYASLPGAGAALEPRLLVAMGTDRDRYQTAAEVQSYSGIAPVTERTGRSNWVHYRFACPKFLRQSFHEFASHSIGQSEWARAYYDRQREAGKSHHAVVRSLAFKWIRIIFRCWKDRKPYDEQTYLRSLQRRASPLTGRKWESVAGFQKLSANPS
jgi:transposase